MSVRSFTAIMAYHDARAETAKILMSDPDTKDNDEARPVIIQAAYPVGVQRKATQPRFPGLVFGQWLPN